MRQGQEGSREMARGLFSQGLRLAFLAALTFAGLTLFRAAPTWAATRCVPDDSPGGCGPTHATIQAAIDVATAGDTIKVAAGTYNEAVLIDKRLTLNGANPGVNPVTETRGDESIIEGTGLSGVTYLVNISASDVVFDGFKVQNSPVFGMWTSGVSSTIQNNIVDNSFGLGVIVAPGNNSQILDNLITNNWDGIYLEFVTTNTLISGNKITGSRATDEGAITFESGGAYTNITIENNIIVDNAGHGIHFWKDLTLSGIEMHYNNIYGNAGYGVLNEVGTTVNATGNWWGCTGGPGASGCDTVSGNVDFKPFLGAYIVSGDSATVPPGGSATASNVPDTSGEVGTTATLTNVGGGSATVNVATYASNPGTPSIIDVGGGFVDLQVTGADENDSLAAKFYYPDTVTGANEAGLSLMFFTGLGWLPVRSSGNTDPVKNTTDNLDGTVSGGRFSVTFDNTSTPKITDLASTEFTMNQEAPIPTLPQWGMILLTLSLLTLATRELAGQPALFVASATGGVVTLVNHRQLLSSFFLGQGLAGLGLLSYAALIGPLVPHDAGGALLAGLLLGAMVEFYRRSHSL